MKKMLLFIGCFCVMIFLLFTYKNFKYGNNISNKNEEEIIDYILNNIKTYTADLEVMFYSNKTQTLYKIKQEVLENKSVQEILSPENISGIKIELEGNRLKISNTKLKLEKIYEDYDAILNNSLFLNVFISDYKKNSSRSYVFEDEIVLETKIENSINTYAKYKELHIDKKNKKISGLIIRDNNKKTRVSIKYNDIEIK